CGGGVDVGPSSYQYAYAVFNDPDLIGMDTAAHLTSVTISGHVVALQPPLSRGQSGNITFADTRPPPPNDDAGVPAATVPCVLTFSDGQTVTVNTIGPGAAGPYRPERAAVVPTVSEWGLIVLGSMLVALGARRISRSPVP